MAVAFAERIAHVPQRFTFTDLGSARLMGDPSITDILGMFCNRLHSLYKYAVRYVDGITNTHFLINSMFPRMMMCLKSL